MANRINRRDALPASAVDPHHLYTLPAFIAVAGLGDTTRRRARAYGVQLKTVNLGRRKYVRGCDGIAFIEELADAMAKDARSVRTNGR